MISWCNAKQHTVKERREVMGEDNGGKLEKAMLGKVKYDDGKFYQCFVMDMKGESP